MPPNSVAPPEAGRVFANSSFLLSLLWSPFSLAPCLEPCDVPDVPLAPAIYQLFDVPRPARDPELQSPMRVEISPASPNVRWWAMVSVTDNATQRIRLFH